MKRWMISMSMMAMTLSLADAEQVLILGDSLSKEYNIQFAIENFPDRVKSWSQILDEKRNGFFDYGSLKTVGVPTEFFFTVPGHEYNWSWPTGGIQDFVDLVRGKTLADQASRSSLEDRIGDVERVVLFVGGNDVDRVYQAAYEGDPIDGFTEDFLERTEIVLDWVIEEAPGREIVLVNTPHVGATPEVKGAHPYDPVLTGNATEAYAEVNRQLARLAADKGVGYADIFVLTLPLLDDEDYCFQGLVFENVSTSSGDQEKLWLAGPAAQDFHPNTLPQTEIANAIIGAFNTRYGSGIPLLSTEEILDEIIGRDPDVSYSEWAACYGVGERGSDEDGDGFSNGIEFGTGGNPLVAEAGLIEYEVNRDGLGVVFGRRLESTARAEQSGALTAWTPLEATPLPDGRWKAFLPTGSGQQFLRVAVPGS